MAGLESVEWPGRLQLVELGGRRWLFDGAHNGHGIQLLARALGESFPGDRPTLVMGILEDKDWQAMCATIAPLAGRILLVPVSSMRTMRPETLAPFCHSANPGIEVTAHARVEDALARVAGDSFLMVTGSLYLVGEVMEKLGISPGRVTDERRLNEWGSPAQGAGR